MSSILFGVVAFYLTLIAKFYRQKFSKGPGHSKMQVALAVLILGLFLKLEFFAFLPPALSYSLICLGGLAFSGLGYALYRTMMSVD